MCYINVHLNVFLIRTSDNKDGSLPLIMFSYAHKDDKFCYRILKEVEQMQNTIKVWIDIQQCAMGDLWEKIADAIEHADVILCFISEYYHQSKSCRQEFIYAVDDLQKPIIPILIGDYKPKGWLGMFYFLFFKEY